MDGCYYLTPFWAGAGAPRYALLEGRHVVGRSERARLVIRDPSVSREHAAIEVHEGEVWIKDLQSKHGTFVNSRRVDRAQLRVGDILIIGHTVVLRLDLEVERDGETQALADLDRTARWNEGPTEGDEDLATRGGFVEAGAGSAVPNLATVGRLCLDNLPTVYARMNMIADQIRQARPSDPAVVLKWLEPLLDKLGQLMKAISQAPGQAPPLVMLGDVVEDALQRAATTLDEREVALQCDVPPGLGLRAPPGPLAEGIAIILQGAARAAPVGSVMVIEASATQEGTEIEVLLPTGLSEGSDATGEAWTATWLTTVHRLLDSVAELELTAGRVRLFIPARHDDEYSSG